MEDVHSFPSPQRHDPDRTTSAPQPPPAHLLIRLIQCPRCSLPLRNPLRLPCGNTICRACLPPTRIRPHITYPAGKGRELGFECSWPRSGSEECAGEHCVADCGVDVLMTELVGVFDEVLAGSAPGGNLKSRVTWREGQEGDVTGREAFLEGGMLRGIYKLVKDGRFDYDATEVMYHESDEEAERTDLEKLAEKMQNELDCHVCYSLILDPLTTPCGHTFCRRCVAGVLSHSDLCPVCRRKLNILSNLQAEPANKRIADLVESLFPDQIAARREALAREDPDADEGTVPLFVCTLSFPGMPTFLHVYERRYRVMMLRVMAGGTRKFGMVTYNRGNRPQGRMGRTPFMEYGTLLMVERFDALPDGRCLVIARGTSRFKVIKSEQHEGYHVGRTERVDDISLTEEETLESREVSGAADAPSSLEDHPGQTPLESMSTQELFELGVNFVQKQRSQGSTWLHPRVLMAYGNQPTDPAQFSWWLASVMPVSEEEKYALLSTTSVRERLKITARWVRALETRRWSMRFYTTSVLWLAVPLLIFGLIPWILGPFASSISLPSARVFTSMTPLAVSVSVSFGSAGPLVLDSPPQQDQSPDGGTSFSPVFVIGGVLALFAVHVVVDLVHGVRTNRSRAIRWGMRGGIGADAAGYQENLNEVQGAEGEATEGTSDVG